MKILKSKNEGIKGEKILLATALFMMAVLIGYNAFFVGSPAGTPEPTPEFMSENSNKSETPKSDLNEENPEKSKDKNSKEVFLPYPKNIESCTMCGLCELSCPDQAITLEKGD